jgi:hypothetical protein
VVKRVHHLELDHQLNVYLYCLDNSFEASGPFLEVQRIAQNMFSAYRFLVTMYVSFIVVQSFLSSHHRWQSHQRRLERNGFSVEFLIDSGNSRSIGRPKRKSTSDIVKLKSSLSSDITPPLSSQGINAGNYSAFLDFDGETHVNNLIHRTTELVSFGGLLNGMGSLDTFLEVL